MRRSLRGEPTEKRRSEQQAGDDFPHDLRLMEPTKKCTEKARSNDDHSERNKDLRKKIRRFRC